MRWSDDDVIEFANKDLKTARNYRALMKVLARNVGEWLSIDELSEKAGLQRAIVKAFRTQMYRHLNVHFPQYDRAPFPGLWGRDMNPRRKDVVWYRVSAAQAAQWERVQSHLA